MFLTNCINIQLYLVYKLLYLMFIYICTVYNNVFMIITYIHQEPI